MWVDSFRLIVPKGVPIGMKAVYFNATAITVEWVPVANTREVMNGVLLGYRVTGPVMFLELMKNLFIFTFNL